MSSIVLRPQLRVSAAPLRRAPALAAPPRPFRFSRNANLIQRPKRPFLHDQIVVLSDGSAFKQLTTSPRGVVRLTKDARNHALWNPSLRELMDVEADEAGRLRMFRERYGRGFDSADAHAADGEPADDESLLDLMSEEPEPKR